MRKTKIVCTLGPASADPAIMKAMLQSGMKVAAPTKATKK